MLIRVFCVVQGCVGGGWGATGLLNKGGREQQASWFSKPFMTMRSNDTLVDTPFQLISGFFHVNQGVLCSEHSEQASCRGVLEGGGGGGGATGLLN